MKHILLIVILSLLISGCQKKDYIIGYTGSLSRDVADISLGGRDGAILAVEEINASGKINDRKLKLLIRDDKDKPDLAPIVDKEIVENGAFAIIGHLNSTMTKAGLEYMNKTNSILLSPNSNSPIFLNKDDQLFCMLPSGKEMVKTIINVLVEDKNTPSLAIIYNNRNSTYSIPISKLLSEMYQQAGGDVLGSYNYHSSSENFNYKEIAEQAISKDPKAIVLVTNAIDGAFFIRNLYDLKTDAILIGADATCNEEILAGSGKPAEGFITVQAYSPTISREKSDTFKESFKKRFGYNPSYDAMFSFSAVKIIAAALNKNSDEKQIKNSLLSLGSFEGLAYNIRFNQYGDNEQPYFVLQVQNGKLVSYK